MGKFCQISTELWPLIYVKMFIPRRSGLGLKMGKFCQICTELWPLIYVIILFPDSILSIY